MRAMFVCDFLTYCVTAARATDRSREPAHRNPHRPVDHSFYLEGVLDCMVRPEDRHPDRLFSLGDDLDLVLGAADVVEPVEARGDARVQPHASEEQNRFAPAIETEKGRR